MPIFLQALLDLLLLFVIVMAIGGALDYISGSIAIFAGALRRYRERNRGED